MDPSVCAFPDFAQVLPKVGNLVVKEGFLCEQRDRDIEVIMKKSGMMLNSFGVAGFYPFLNRETDACGVSLGVLNHEKLYYKMVVRRILGRDISRNLEKVGGGTDILFMFSDIVDDVAASIGRDAHLQRAIGVDELQTLLSPRNLFEREAYMVNVILPLLYLHVAIQMFSDAAYRHDGCSPSVRTLEDFL
jgi:hypothetical protein